MKRMSRIQQIYAYINKCGMPLDLSDRYDLNPKDLIAIVKAVKRDAYASALLAFTFGQAKGYRAGRLEAKRRDRD